MGQLMLPDPFPRAYWGLVHETTNLAPRLLFFVREKKGEPGIQCHVSRTQAFWGEGERERLVHTVCVCA